MDECKRLQSGHLNAQNQKRQKVQITEMDKVKIYELWEDGLSAGKIAIQYGITDRYVRLLLEKGGYGKESRRSKHYKEIENAIEALKADPFQPIHRIVQDKNVRRAVKARWDKIKGQYEKIFKDRTDKEISRIKDIIKKNPRVTFEELGYDEDKLTRLRKNEEFGTINSVRDDAIFSEWTGLYLLRGQNILSLIQRGKIVTNGCHLKHLNDKDIDVVQITIDESDELQSQSAKKMNRKGGDTRRCRIIELMK